MILTPPHSLVAAPSPPPPPVAGLGPTGEVLGATGQWTANRLRTELLRAALPVDEAFIQRVIGSRALQNALAFCSSTEDVSTLFALANAEPLSQTRAAVLGDTGVAIDGDIAYPHRTTALFKWAFDGAVPSVLKLPQGVGAAERECCLYDDVGSAARVAGIQLVPVRLLRMRGTHTVAGDVTTLRAGVLMPSYPVTLAAAPAVVVLRHGARFFSRLEACLQLLAERGWVHGDVKPSNIFLAGDSEPWLGDYGSSVTTVAAHAEFRGGTPQYQLEGVPVDARDGAFDRAGLIVSLLDAAGLLRAGSRDPLPWPLAAIRVTIGRLGDDGLRSILTVALDRVVAVL